MSARSDVPEVFIDGEKVVFEGTLPATLGELQHLLEHALGESGRVLAALSVDGQDFSGVQPATPFDSAARIEVVSLFVHEARERMANEVVAMLAEARGAIDALAGEVLRSPWDESAGSCVRAAEMLGRVLHGASSAVGDSSSDHPVKSAAEELARALERWMDVVQARDVAAVSLRCDRELLPVLARLDAAFGTRHGGGAMA